MMDVMTARKLATELKSTIVEQQDKMNQMEASFYETSYAVYRGEDVDYLSVIVEEQDDSDNYVVILKRTLTNKNDVVINEKSVVFDKSDDSRNMKEAYQLISSH